MLGVAMRCAVHVTHKGVATHLMVVSKMVSKKLAGLSG